MVGISIETLGDQALLLRLGDHLDPEINLRVHRLAAHLRQQSPPWLLDCVPAFASLALFVDTSAFPDSVDPMVEARAWLETQLKGTNFRRHADTSSAEHEVPVCYDRDFALDLDEAATELGMNCEQMIARHVSGHYRVAMLGFAAGFPYLLGLDPTLALPRLATPRSRVPAGSVAIGGAQTGIYPRESPGGWRIIGCTPLLLFDAKRHPPALFAPGDGVRFKRIRADEFLQREARR